MSISARIRFRFVASLCTVSALVAVTGAATATALASITSGGTATIAQQPGSVPNYVFPLVNGSDATGSDVMQFQYSMYRPLYWNGEDGHPVANPKLSLACPPTYSNNG